MDHLAADLLVGLSTAVSPYNLLYCFFGVVLGTLVGVLPGLGPVATIAMLLPVTFALPPAAALIMLAGIYYGAQYGGSTTAILIKLPGEVSSAVTAIDGHEMTRNGKAGLALATAAIASFIAGTIGNAFLVLFAPALSLFALSFGPAEYFALMLLGLMAAALLAQGPLPKTIGMTLLGLLLGLIGTDVETGLRRFDLGIPELSDGVGFIVLAMGIYGVGEILSNLEDDERQRPFARAIKLMPTWHEVKSMLGASFRGTAVGSLLGLLPGGGATLASFTAYSLERQIAKDPTRFGKGAIEGVAAPEAANNAAAQTSFIPMLTLGIPSNPVMALMIGAMMIQGIQPGPAILTNQPQIFWGLVISMWIGNVFLVILNLPLVGIWIKLLSVPYRTLYPAILIFCIIGVLGLNNSTFEVGLLAVFGILGYLFVKLDCEPAPLLMGFILGPMMEENLRLALVLSRGNVSVFFVRPISLGILTLTAISVAAFVVASSRRSRAPLAASIAGGGIADGRG